MTVPNALTTLLDEHNKLFMGDTINSDDYKKYIESVVELMEKSNVTSYHTFSLLELYRIEQITSTANKILLSLCIEKMSPIKHLPCVKDILLAKVLKFPFNISFEELQSICVELDFLLLYCFFKDDIKQITSLYNSILDAFPDYKRSIFEQSIILRAIEIHSNNGGIKISQLKQELECISWFTIELTVLKASNGYNFNILFDFNTDYITITKSTLPKVQPITITTELVEQERNVIQNSTQVMEKRISEAEEEERKKKEREARRKKLEEEDAREEAEYQEKKRKKKKQKNNMKADSANEMQRLLKMQQKVKIKEEKDKQMSDLFEKYFYRERARRSVEKEFTQKKIDEESNEIREMYRVVCESKEKMRKAEHDRRLAMKSKFGKNAEVLQTWLDSIGKGESEEQIAAREEKIRKEKEEKERQERERIAAERRAKELEEKKKREEEEKRIAQEKRLKEEEAFKKNQELLAKKKESTTVDQYTPKVSGKYTKDDDGWMSKPGKKSTASFSSKPSKSSSYQPPRSTGTASFTSNRPSGTASFTSNRPSGTASFTSSRPSSGVPSFSSKPSGVPSFSGKRGTRGRGGYK
ncbi:PCI domain-containing protein [Entamoeba marina]